MHHVCSESRIHAAAAHLHADLLMYACAKVQHQHLSLQLLPVAIRCAFPGSLAQNTAGVSSPGTILSLGVPADVGGKWPLGDN